MGHRGGIFSCTRQMIQSLKNLLTSRAVSFVVLACCRILSVMTSGGPIGYTDDDIEFTLSVLKDGAGLEWESGQYEKRKKAVRGILVGCSSEVWKKDEFAFGLVSDAPEDLLFRKKGWNKMDSGFRLWGGGGKDDEIQQRQAESRGGDSSSDSFLASKGWNDIDSGFRFL